MNKLNRNYSLLVAEQSSPVFVDSTFLEIRPPFTVEFTITRSNLQSAKQAHFRLYNLSAEHRAKLRHDYNNTSYQPILFNAGYGNTIPLIFQGRVTQAWSVREGVDFISELVCDDCGFSLMQGNADTSFSEGTPYTQIIRTLISSLPGITVGAIGSTYTGSLVRGNTYGGNPVTILNDITRKGFFIDNGKAYALADNECIQGGISTIDKTTGLLGTPTRETGYVNLQMIFEPRLLVGQRIFLDTQTGEKLSGFYKVTGLRHQGIISPTVSGQAITEVTLAPGDFIFV